MPTREEALAEAYKRGLMPPEQRAAYEEGIRRGLVKGDAYSQKRATISAEQAKAPRGLAQQWADNIGLTDEFAGVVEGGKQGLINLVSRAQGKPISTPMGVAYAAGRDQERQAEAEYNAKHKVQGVIGALALPVAGGAGLIKSAPTALSAANRAGVLGATTAGALGVTNAEGGLIDRGKAGVESAALGYGLGVTGQLAGGLIGKSGAKAAAKPSTAARNLANQGVILTPGQIMGGVVKRVEDAATSVPITGDAIRSTQRRGVESLNRVGLNRVLEPIGETLPADVNVGREGLQRTHEAVSNAYKKALDGVTVTPDATLTADIDRIATSHNLRGATADELETVVADLREALKGPISGTELKALDEDLGFAIRSIGPGATARKLKTALEALQGALDDQLGRTSGTALAGKQAADAAYANLVRIEGASGMVGARGGLFSAPQLQSAVRAADKSARKTQFARGQALMQDLSDDAVDVMPPSVPDSGTAIRSLLNSNAIGAATGVVSGAPAAVIYSKPVVNAVNAIYKASTPGAKRIAMSRLAKLAAADPGLAPLLASVTAAVDGEISP